MAQEKGVTLETTNGGRVVDGWDELNKGYAWDHRAGPPPHGRDFWAGISEKYVEGVEGKINTIQTPEKLGDPRTLFQGRERPVLLDKLNTGEVTSITMNTVDGKGNLIPLTKNHSRALLSIAGIDP